MVATEVKALAVQTQSATEEITKKIEALQKDATGSADAVHRISQAIEAIRPVFEHVNGAVVEQNQITGEIGQNAASASHFIVSVGTSAGEIDSATQEAAAHGDNVARAGKAVTAFAQKLKARCAVLLRQNEREDRRRSERLPCSLGIEIKTARGTITAPVYELAMDGILIGGPEADKLPAHENLSATLQDIGACRIRIGERSRAGAQARFEAPTAELREKIEDRMWAIHEENTEFVTRAMQAGSALTKIFENAVAGGAVTVDDLFDTDYVEIPGTNPVQYRTKMLDWAGARCRRSRKRSSPGIRGWRSASRSTRTAICPSTTSSTRIRSGRATSPTTPRTAATAASSTIRRGLPPAATSAPI